MNQDSSEQRHAHLTGSAFRLFATAGGLSFTGDALRTFTMMLWVFDATQSGTIMAVLLVAITAPGIVLGLWAGAIVDRCSLRSILVASDVGRAVIGTAIFACVWRGYAPAAIALVSLSSCVGVLGAIAARAAVPTLVPSERLERANGIISMLEQSSFVTGPAAAAWLFAHFGATPALMVDAATFVASAILMRTALKTARQDVIDTEPAPQLRLAVSAVVGVSGGSLLRDVRAGIRYVVQHKTLRTAIGVGALQAISAGINNTVMIFFITRVLNGRPENLAWLSISNGIAQVLVGGTIVALAEKASLRRSLRAGGLLMAGGALIIVSAPSLPLLVAGVLVTALGNAPMSIGHVTFEQRYARADFLGRVRGVDEMVVPAAFVLGSVVGGVAVDVTGPRAALGLSATLLCLAAFSLETGVVRRLRIDGEESAAT